MQKKSKKMPKYYAVANGREPGIYATWDECEDQVVGYSRAKYKAFRDLNEAAAFICSWQAKQNQRIPGSFRQATVDEVSGEFRARYLAQKKFKKVS